MKEPQENGFSFSNVPCKGSYTGGYKCLITSQGTLTVRFSSQKNGNSIHFVPYKNLNKEETWCHAPEVHYLYPPYNFKVSVSVNVKSEHEYNQQNQEKAIVLPPS